MAKCNQLTDLPFKGLNCTHSLMTIMQVPDWSKWSVR